MIPLLITQQSKEMMMRKTIMTAALAALVGATSIQMSLAQSGGAAGAGTAVTGTTGASPGTSTGTTGSGTGTTGAGNNGLSNGAGSIQAGRNSDLNPSGNPALSPPPGTPTTGAAPRR